MRLLVVDFDYFFRNPDPLDDEWEFYDWSHSEGRTPFYDDFLWRVRAAGFLQHGRPLPPTTGLEQSFWSRFTFSKKARCFTSNSNLWSMNWRIRKAVHHVDLFDAHHDAGYKTELGRFWSCENWAMWYLASGATVTVHYPTWRKRVFELEDYCYAENGAWPITRQFDSPHHHMLDRYDKVHVCRSDAWVPPWCDAAFDAFLAACPLPKVALEPLRQRPMDMTAVQEDVDAWLKVKALYDEQHHHA